MDLMRIRRAMLMAQVASGGGLPSAYKEVEYIQSNGNQYIDTGVLFNHGIKITASMAWVSKSGALFGARTDTDATRFYVTWYNNNVDFGYGADYQASISYTEGDRLDLIYDTSQGGASSFEITNYEYTRQVTSRYIETNVTGYIFAYHRASDNSVVAKSAAKFYSMVIEDENGNVLFNGVPCYRNADGEIGIYDLATSTFLTNLGSGTFSKGADV